MSDLILYTSEDGKSRLQLRAKDETVWLSQREMGELFDVSTDNVGLHLKNIFAEGELDENSVTEESSVTAADGKNYRTKLSNLDAVLAAATQKLAALKTHKKGLMQQLFPSPEEVEA